MFSLRTATTATGGDATTTPAPAAPPVPKFPIYLLPSFSIPFRRRRQSSATSYGSPRNDNTVPSLSTTPTDSTVSSPVEGPPTPTLFPSSWTPSEDHRRASIEPLDIGKLTQTQPDTIRCSTCGTDFAFCSQIVSKGFTGRYGRAYLVSAPTDLYPQKEDRDWGRGVAAAVGGDLINIKVDKPETRLLVTGSHVVADIACAVCHAKVGWKYVDAKEESQRYKVGKFILETRRCVGHRSWEDVPVSEMPEVEVRRKDNPLVPDDGRQEDTIIFDSEDEDECEEIFSGTWDPEIVAKRRSRKVNQRPNKS
ncbi:hypothetical protein DL770_009743 [Monosporascus sp. CRB-9-2]|nr:hypothetical protein DL770_009743 [Monosporascus sp. CRB-9-2]